MTQCIVIADDLTGGNATGVRLRRNGFTAITVLGTQSLEDAATRGTFDCVIHPTDSRSLSPGDAASRVREAALRMRAPGVRVWSKRIDSTLRGNLGAETDAMLDVLGEDSIAVVVPSFPSSGRVVVGGHLLVDGTPLHRTDIAIDPKCPVTVSSVKAVLESQSRHAVAALDLSFLSLDSAALAEAMLARVAEGARILAFDAVTQDDLELIADAVVASGIRALAVDPGAFTATLARKVLTPGAPRNTSRILVVVGSVHPATARQVETLMLTQRLFRSEVVSRALLATPARRARDTERVVAEARESCGGCPVTLVAGDGLRMENRIHFEPYMRRYNCTLDEVTGMTNDGFARIARELLLQVPEFSAIYTSGGDITVAVCKALGASGIALADEVLPLAAYGRFVDGDAAGVHIVTKGGSQGDENAIVDCIDYLKMRLSI